MRKIIEVRRKVVNWSPVAPSRDCGPIECTDGPWETVASWREGSVNAVRAYHELMRQWTRSDNEETALTGVFIGDEEVTCALLQRRTEAAERGQRRSLDHRGLVELVDKMVVPPYWSRFVREHCTQRGLRGLTPGGCTDEEYADFKAGWGIDNDAEKGDE